MAKLSKKILAMLPSALPKVGECGMIVASRTKIAAHFAAKESFPIRVLLTDIHAVEKKMVSIKRKEEKVLKEKAEAEKQARYAAMREAARCPEVIDIPEGPKSGVVLSSTKEVAHNDSMRRAAIVTNKSKAA